MSQRVSGFARVPADLYQTPAWVIDALNEHIQLDGLSVWEPACGEGQMVEALEEAGASAHGTDLIDHGYGGMRDVLDFTDRDTPLKPLPFYFQAIITNPPYGKQCRTAVAFIEAGLAMLPSGGLLALLLPVDFDSAKGRARYFGDCPEFSAKIVLRRRIVWFEQEGTSSPSANHAWFIWTRQHQRRPVPPVTLYAPTAEAA